MRKISALIVTLFIGGNVFAQLSIKPSAPHQDHFIYVNNSLLFVAQEVNLHKNWEGEHIPANIYLRSEAQLLQGSTGETQNKGDGSISIFQEGTSNAFDYNYWSSPVGTSSTPPLFGISMLYAPLNQTESTRAQITDELDGSSFPLTISSRWIHTYAGNAYSSWKYIGNKTEIPAGYGFSMKGVNGTDPTVVDGRPNNPGNSQRYDFRGMPNNGILMVPVASGDHVLTGNPYPSALDLSLFLLENSGSGIFQSSCYGNITRTDRSTGIAYFWDSKEDGSSHYLADYVGGYGAFSPVDPCTTGIYERPVFSSYGNKPAEQGEDQRGNHYERRYLPIGQGFMIEGTSNDHLIFKNTYRVFKKEGDYSDFKQQSQRSEQELQVIPKLRLQIEINEHYTRNLTLGFWPTATSGMDLGMDARTFDLTPTDVGWLHDDSSYMIDVRPFLETDEIPLYLTVEDSLATFKFKLVERENIENAGLFIVDREKDEYFPLDNGLFEIALESGTHHQRLALVFREKGEKPPHVEEKPVIEDEESSNEDEELANEGEEPFNEDEELSNEDEESSNEDEKPFIENEDEDRPIDKEEPLFHEPKDLIILHHNGLKQIEIFNPDQKCISRLILYNLNGKEVKTWNSPRNDESLILSTKNLPESLYFLKVVQENSTEITKKILILE